MASVKRTAEEKTELLKKRLTRVTAGVLAVAAVVEMVSVAFIRFDDRKK